MLSDPPSAPDPAVFERNLAAIQRVDLDLARLLVSALQAVDGVRSARPALTRDGQWNYRLLGEDGPMWLGRTSIPAIRAEALLAHFDTAGRSVLLPGAGNGLEARLLAERLGPRQAVFVWEQSEIPLILALRLHDFEELLLAQRLIFLLAGPEQFGATLLRWLEAHPARPCPSRIFMWPWQSLAEVSGYRAAVEEAYQAASSSRKGEAGLSS
jgi:hypothetical protein